MILYHYASLPARVLTECARLPVPPDAYLAMDQETATLIDILKKGYRFVTVIGELALFEKGFSQPPTVVTALLDQNETK